MRHRVSPECGVFTRVLPRIRPHHCIQFKAVYDETEDIKSPSLYLYLYNHNLRLHFNTIINITNKELSILLIHVSTDTRTLQSLSDPTLLIRGRKMYDCFMFLVCFCLPMR
jgi:hypothetical protein